MTRLQGSLLLAGLAACRFGGPSGSPDDYVVFLDAGDDGTVSVEGDDATTAPPPEDSPAASFVDSSGDDAFVGPSTPDGDRGCGPSVAVCDPVHNSGCNPLQQCDVDPSQTTTPTGLCVFNGGSADAATCTSSIVNESCAPGMTCVRTACRSLCFCDSDCHPGQCCSDTSGPAGFLLCQSCE